MSPTGADKIERANQQPSPGTLVDLFEMDLTLVSGDVFRFTPCVAGEQLALAPVSFGGELYLPQPIKIDSYEWSAGQQFPRPKMRVSNVLGAFGAAIRDYDDLLGVTVRRIRTYSRHLDDGDDPDTEQIFPTEIYVIERKANQNMMEIEFDLSSPMDQQGRMLPGRTIHRNACGLRYRRYSSDIDPDLPLSQRFTYSGYNVCPYAGDLMFDINDYPTTDPAQDRCGKRLSSCELRFPLPQNIPAWFFPGVGRLR